MFYRFQYLALFKQLEELYSMIQFYTGFYRFLHLKFGMTLNHHGLAYLTLLDALFSLLIAGPIA